MSGGKPSFYINTLSDNITYFHFHLEPYLRQTILETKVSLKFTKKLINLHLTAKVSPSLKFPIVIPV